MKFDGNPFFSHVSLVHQPDCKPFQYNGDAQDTTVSKLGNMKEDKNRTFCAIKGFDRAAEPLPFEHNYSIDNFTNANMNKFQDTITQCAIPSNSKELLERGIHFYTDRNVIEGGRPESIVCCKEPTFHFVKDICVDEGVLSQDKILVENKDEHTDSCTFPTPDGDKSSELSKEKSIFIIPEETKISEEDSKGDGADQCDSKKPTHKNDASIDGKDKIANDTAEENITPENMPFKGESDTEKSHSKLVKFDGNEVEQSSAQVPSEEVNLESPALSAGEELNSSSIMQKLSYDSKVESGSITFHFDSATPAASSSGKHPASNDYEQPHETHHLSRLDDRISDCGVALSSLLHHSTGEASFSAAGPLSGAITYSGPVAYSGSLSLRSDSSTTSTRSFAFPVLQSEWNSSPVRMAKADQRRFRKHGNWRHGLLCCRF
ncbi:uncharacterized protein LOC131153251 isoform X3 [Malania oleifera]|uniref:uncharacterized protein LOC131153251 isoform X3 n=1 Tax=Malania oleifera TaxID=397392 RepID=UPI0025ADC41C|nr:uncharacterized protein LOC131153251 isoform X3 [Malania oleifera]XP_057961413.1 uncharacterized protein LOC131153251 isoform X3 [Malania oleifera]XP_057961414.1 uncharacterized protein LOC131153251 isoform X3 [Malania oleifera]XP_057961416.1 uncharacterized protein LOC131153251 isoform X3 [Malania oleifera]XP_057961417.1 uncharacterized protein LOC131153251 isoform X3 [Malania oleifera]XP_057961418.1 uncharacterized protein LOC131153251 isoform X3 [Malania oleifera]